MAVGKGKFIKTSRLVQVLIDNCSEFQKTGAVRVRHDPQA